MEDLARYLDEIVEPTINDFNRNPASIRHAFLACVATFHSVDYLAYNRTSRLRDAGKAKRLVQRFRKASEDFAVVEDVALAFKHVVSSGRPEPRVRSENVVRQQGPFSSGFSAGFAVQRVTIVDRPDVSLLVAVKRALRFLREYEPGERAKA
jgi:hypothetical protein